MSASTSAGGRPGPRGELTLSLPGRGRDVGAAGVTAALQACPGVERAHVDPYLTWALTAFDTRRTTPERIVEHLRAAGVDATVTHVFDPEGPTTGAGSVSDR